MSKRLSFAIVIGSALLSPALAEDMNNMKGMDMSGPGGDRR